MAHQQMNATQARLAVAALRIRYGKLSAIAKGVVEKQPLLGRFSIDDLLGSLEAFDFVPKASPPVQGG
jgi:hypothetical protein